MTHLTLHTGKLIRATLATLASVAAVSLTSCDSVIYEDLPLCAPSYSIRLTFDRTIDGSDRTEEVKAAEAYAFDKSGKLITVTKANHEELKANNWTLPIVLSKDEEHRVIVWGGLTEDAPFALDGTRAVETPEDLICRLLTTSDDGGNSISNSRIDGLFHTDSNLTFHAEDSYEEQPVTLTKSSNELRIILRKENGGPISHEDYDFLVEEDNGVLGPDNKVIRGEKLWYHPVARDGFETAIPDGKGGLTDVKVPAAVADMHMVRLTPDSEGKVIVKLKSTGEELINTSLIPLLLAVKEFEAPNMDDQEFLDREDTFTIHLVLDENEMWITTQIYINDWIIVYQSVEW